MALAMAVAVAGQSIQKGNSRDLFRPWVGAGGLAEDAL
jgi:hypothetical protein